MELIKECYMGEHVYEHDCQHNEPAELNKISACCIRFTAHSAEQDKVNQ